MQAARITVFAGHYGSGKTTLAINYALWLRRQGKQVTVCDLDIVNPYFRTADATEALQQAGISIISSPFANSNVDAPAMPAETRRVFDEQAGYAVMDLGGDDRGALALGRYAKLLQADDYEMLLVLNSYRPLTRNIPDLQTMREEIERASGVPFTGLVNNSNLGAETSLADVLDSLDFAQQAEMALSLPVKMTALNGALLPPQADGNGQDEPMQAAVTQPATVLTDAAQAKEALEAMMARGELFAMDVYKKPIWKI